MATVTKITTPAKSPKKRAVYLDGKWGFNVPANVAERFGLKVGMELSPAEVEKITAAQLQQKALDKGLAILSTRLHSRSELRTKLLRAKYTEAQTEAALGELERLGYVNDTRFAVTKAQSAAEHRKHGRRRAYVELIKSGVERETARRASEEVFDAHDSLKVARELAAKKTPSLRRLDNQTARRRLTGMLLRRGFTFDEIKPVLDEYLGGSQEEVVPEGVNPATGEVAPTPEPAAEVDADETADDEKPGDEARAENWRAAMLPAHMRKKEKPKSRWSSFRRGGPRGGDSKGSGR